MRLKSFRVTNYKCINDSGEVSIGDYTVLVGKNESGKTSIMEAIRLFYQMIKGVEPEVKQLNEIRPKGIGFTGAIEISSTLLFEDSDRRKIEKYWKQDLNKRSQLEIPDEFSYDYKIIFELHTYKKIEHLCTFTAKTASSKRNLYDTDNENWNKLISFIKDNINANI